MKAITLNEREIIRYTVKNLSHGIDVPTSVTKAAQLEVLKKRMMAGEVVRFCFRKVSTGEIVYRVGTLQSDAVEANIVGTGLPKRFYGQFAYIDLTCLAWRSFLPQNFVGIVD